MIKWELIKAKRNSGKEKTVCPACSHNRKKKTDPCLSVNHEKGVAKCWNCDEISIRDIKPQKQYKLPPQQWTNHTVLSDQMVKYFSKRGISQQTLIDCKVTEEVAYQPAQKKEMNCIVFNYFEGEKLVNKKFRSGNKDFTQVSGAKKMFYGINDVITENECFIVEGEIDKLSLWELGIKNCISVPNGANDVEVFENCEEYIRSIEKFYIAVDMDEPGQHLEQELIKRLGKHKCQRVHFKNKDANEDLVEAFHVLQTSLENLTEYPVDGTFSAKDVKNEIYDLYDNGFEKVIKLDKGHFKGFADTFAFLRSQLTVVTGIPGHGKSNFIEWFVLYLIIEYNFKASFYSPEHFPMQQHHMIMSEKVMGKSSEKGAYDRMKKSELAEYIKWSEGKIFLTMPKKAVIPGWDWVFERFEEQIYRHGIDVFVIDAFNKVKLKTGTLLEMNEVLARLTLFCQMHNVSVFLIAHPTKMKKEEGTDRYIMPTLYDVKGSGDFYDQTHNGLTVYRVFSDDPMEQYTKVVATKLKFRHQGEAGKETAFKFNRDNGRYYTFTSEDKGEPIIKCGKDNDQIF